MRSTEHSTYSTLEITRQLLRPFSCQLVRVTLTERGWGREERRGEERGQGRRHRAGEPSPGPKEAAAARPAVTT